MVVFFLKDTATTEIYTLSLPAALPILVARLKYRNARASLAWLARAMAALVDRRGTDVVTWVPTTPARRRQRGFDQAELLRSEEHTSELQSRQYLVCRLLLEKKKQDSES